jgi:hypothetical protein
MSMATPADAMVGAVTALAAMHNPKNNALREAFIKHSLLKTFGHKQPNLSSKTAPPWCALTTQPGM